MENIRGERSILLLPSSSASSSSDINGSSYYHRQQEPIRRSRSRVKSMKEEASEENSTHDESVWEERPLKFPIRDEGDVVLRKVRSVMNKISTVNYTKLRKRWLNLIPSESSLLMEVIRLIVSKAINEPMYQCIYARLVSNALTTRPSNVAQTIRNNLITHIHSLLQRLATDMEISKFNHSLERDRNYARHRKVMLHRFIAELFLESVCSAKFMTHKVTELIGQGRKSQEDADVSVECLCVLLTFAGAKLEETKGVWLEETLQKINLREMINSPTVSKRIQFMVLDLLEMKSKGWVPHNRWWTPSVDIGALDDAASMTLEMEVTSPVPQVNTIQRNSKSLAYGAPRGAVELEWRVRSEQFNSSRQKPINAKPIHEILNKVVPGNMETMVARLMNLLLKQERLMTLYCDLILTHVCEDALFTKVHATLLARVSEKVPRFHRLITQKLPKLITETHHPLTGIWFLAEWYNRGLVSVGEVIGIMNKFLAAGSPPIESLCAFFLLTGQKLNSVPRGRIWMKPALRKLEALVAQHEYRLKCFVWDILDLQDNNWERTRSLNWIHQFTPSDFFTTGNEDELEPILKLLDTNYKAGVQALRSMYGTKERNIDKFAYNAIMWAIGHRDVEMMRVTGRCIRKLSGFKGLLAPEKLRGVVSDLVMVTASSVDSWNNLGIVMSELYSTQQ